MTDRLPVCVCQGMMEQSKRASLSVARSILNHKVIGKKLESYLKVCASLILSHKQKFELFLIKVHLSFGRVKTRSLVTRMTMTLRIP